MSDGVECAECGKEFAYGAKGSYVTVDGMQTSYICPEHAAKEPGVPSDEYLSYELDVAFAKWLRRQEIDQFTVQQVVTDIERAVGPLDQPEELIGGIEAVLNDKLKAISDQLVVPPYLD